MEEDNLKAPPTPKLLSHGKGFTQEALHLQLGGCWQLEFCYHLETKRKENSNSSCEGEVAGLGRPAALGERKREVGQGPGGRREEEEGREGKVETSFLSNRAT